jgi:mannose-6-phosphate isomerase-like protein (cupin superfamily)
LTASTGSATFAAIEEVDHARTCAQARDHQLREAEGTPGLRRRVAFEADGHWFGHVEAAPETMSGWCHHGDNVTMGYVLQGKVTLEFGPDGSEQVEVNEGEYFRGSEASRAP